MTLLINPIEPTTITGEIEAGLDFLLEHFDQSRLFPRTIMTKKLGYQKEVFSREEALKYFQESDCLDCRINAFPSFTEYKGIQRYPPDLLFVDLDVNPDPPLHKDLINTLTMIKQTLTFDNRKEVKPTVIMSGNGFHILQPIYCPEVLENIKEFQGFEYPSEELLRFAKDYLSNNKADKGNYPSFHSCLLRIPGSINTKDGKMVKVKIIQKWNDYRPPAYNLLLEFKRYLRKKKVNDLISSKHKKQQYPNIQNIDPSYYQWIEKLLQVGIEDCRKDVLDLIIIPYLVHIKKYADTETTTTNAKKWLELCDKVRRLDDKRNFFHTRIPYAIKSTLKKQILPMSTATIKSESRWKDLYKILRNKGILM